MFAHILSVRKGEYILLLNLWDKTMKVKLNLMVVCLWGIT